MKKKLLLTAGLSMGLVMALAFSPVGVQASDTDVVIEEDASADTLTGDTDDVTFFDEDPDEETDWEEDGEEISVRDDDTETAANDAWIDDKAWNKQDKKKAAKVQTDSTGGTEETQEAVQETETSVVPAATVRAAKVPTTAASADKNYKTGVGLGSDIYLLLSAGTGLLALLLLVRRARR